MLSTQATELLENSKNEFDECQEKVKKEIKLFERQKSKDLKKSIKDYVNLSIRYEKIKLQNLEKTLSDMQQPVIKSTPFMYQQQYQSQQEQQLQLSPSQSLSHDEESASIASTATKRKRQKDKQHLHQNYKELQKPLQSSASLPTRSHRKSTDNDSDSSESHTGGVGGSGSGSGGGGNGAATATGGGHHDYHTGNNRISMSASYDDRRLSSTNWLSDPSK